MRRACEVRDLLVSLQNTYRERFKEPLTSEMMLEVLRERLKEDKEAVLKNVLSLNRGELMIAIDMLEEKPVAKSKEKGKSKGKSKVRPTKGRKVQQASNK